MLIVYKSIHLINYETQQATMRTAPQTFDAYVTELIHHINENNRVREYKTRSNATEVIGCILSVCGNED